MKITKNTLLVAAACCMIVILFGGCAALSNLTAKQESLEERVNNYMQAQIDGKWDYAYSFFDTSSREKITRESYLSQPRNLYYKGFKVEEIDVLPSADQATVKVSIDLLFMGYDFKGASQKQNWVKEKGTWFLSRPQKAIPFSHQQ